VHDLVNGTGGEAGSGRVLADAVFAGRDVDAEELVAGDVAGAAEELSAVTLDKLRFGC
jgi:hypothetical protein